MFPGSRFTRISWDAICTHCAVYLSGKWRRLVNCHQCAADENSRWNGRHEVVYLKQILACPLRTTTLLEDHESCSSRYYLLILPSDGDISRQSEMDRSTSRGSAFGGRTEKFTEYIALKEALEGRKSEKKYCVFERPVKT